MAAAVTIDEDTIAFAVVNIAIPNLTWIYICILHTKLNVYRPVDVLEN